MKKVSLIERFKSVQRYRRRVWLDALSESHREQLTELRDAYVSGKLKDASGATPSAAAIHRLIVDELKITVSETSVKKWLRP